MWPESVSDLAQPGFATLIIPPTPQQQLRQVNECTVHGLRSHMSRDGTSALSQQPSETVCSGSQLPPAIPFLIPYHHPANTRNHNTH